VLFKIALKKHVYTLIFALDLNKMHLLFNGIL
jgi:hypothetical protein